MESITSRNNLNIKSACMLKESSERKKTGCFLLEGARLCFDAGLNNNEILQFFVTENALQKYKKECDYLIQNAKKSYLITDNVADKLSDTKNSQQVFAVCKMKEAQHEILPDGMYVFTDNIQNPDNLAAIVRTAEALGVNGIIVNSGCDIYSPKAQRAAMGALLRFPIIKAENSTELLQKCRSLGMEIYASVVNADAKSVTEINRKNGAVLVIGNEGNGISEEALHCCTSEITIPMKGKAESLNASAAASILIWEFMK